MNVNMSGAKYSQEEIEQKRLLALQRKQAAQSKVNTVAEVRNCKPDNKLQYEKSKSNVPQGKSFGVQKQIQTKIGPSGVTKTPKANERYNPINSKTFYGSKQNVTGKCYMISDKRFAVETSTFIPALVETFKTISSKLYDAKTKMWNFHIKDYDTLIEKIAHSQSGIHITGIPKPVLQVFRKNLDSENKISDADLSKIDPKLVNDLMPFQREGICYGISKNGRCIIADDMGLGKTIQALGIAHYFKEDWPLLIIAPSSIRYQWSEAIYNFLPSIPTQHVHQFVNTKDFIDPGNITIVSYDLLVRAIDTFQQHVFGFVIADESHALKSSKTARFKAVQKVASRARHVLLLSGTPALSRPIELYSQVTLVMPHFMGYQEYGIRYCAGEKNAFGWDFSGSSNMLELQIFLKATCMIRRMKQDVLNQLPSKIRQIIILDPHLIKAGTTEMVEMSKKLEKKVLTGMERHNALIQYYSESSVARLKAVCNYITNLFESRRKCLVFAHHQTVLDAICEIAESMKIRYIRIDGRTSSEQRKFQIDRFQDRDDYLVAVLSITAANSGITLTAAQLVVFTELFWNPGILCQAEDRVHRIGQDNSVIIQYLVAKQTADDYLWPLIQRKMNVLNEAGLDQNFSLKEANISKQQISEKNQLTLNSFIIKDDSSPTESQKNDENKQANSETDHNKSTEAEEYKELLEFDEDVFDSCDWDNI